MADTKAVLRHIAELYAKPKKDQSPEDAIREYEEKLNLRFEDYDNAFMEFYTADLIRSVDNFWRFKSDKTRPKLVEITAFLRADNKVETVEKPNVKAAPKCRYVSLEAEYMRKNKDSNLYKNYLRTDYTRAISHILNDLLPEKIGFSAYLPIKFDYNEKVNLAQRNGLFDDFNGILTQTYNQTHGIADDTDNLASVSGF